MGRLGSVSPRARPGQLFFPGELLLPGMLRWLKSPGMLRWLKSPERAVVVIEHDMDFVGEIADLVSVLHEGQLLGEGSMEKVRNDPRVIQVYLGR